MFNHLKLCPAVVHACMRFLEPWWSIVDAKRHNTLGVPPTFPPQEPKSLANLTNRYRSEWLICPCRNASDMTKPGDIFFVKQKKWTIKKHNHWKTSLDGNCLKHLLQTKSSHRMVFPIVGRKTCRTNEKAIMFLFTFGTAKIDYFWAHFRHVFNATRYISISIFSVLVSCFAIWCIQFYMILDEDFSLEGYEVNQYKTTSSFSAKRESMLHWRFPFIKGALSRKYRHEHKEWPQSNLAEITAFLLQE